MAQLAVLGCAMVAASFLRRHRRQSMPRVRLGVCCMEKKMKTKPMQKILSALREHERLSIEVIPFSQDMILNAPVETWPACEYLIAFFSEGFPLDKAIAYTHLHRPFCFNDLPMQKILLDRRAIYEVMESAGVAPPTYLVASRDGYRGQPPAVVLQGADYIEVNGVRMETPFVEKPVDAEDHAVHIYHRGGGVHQVHRKVGDKAAAYDPEGRAVRMDGSYIYERFIPTDGSCDVKVYAVGPSFAHAERRKAAHVDGTVDRTEDGREVRVETALSPREQAMIGALVVAFKQTVCGFDLLRSSVDGSSAVCDVNGWSFVKHTDGDYPERCAAILVDAMVTDWNEKHVQN